MERKNENTFCSLIEVVKGKNGKNMFKCWSHTGTMLGVYSMKELLERNQKFHLSRHSKNKNFIYDKKKGILKLKPINTSDMDVAIGKRINTERFMKKVENEIDNFQGISAVLLDDYNIDADELANVYGLREEVWEKVLDHIEYKTQYIIRKMEADREFREFVESLSF